MPNSTRSSIGKAKQVPLTKIGPITALMNKTTVPSADVSPQGRDGSKVASGGLKIAEPTDKEKLFTIDE